MNVSKKTSFGLCVALHHHRLSVIGDGRLLDFNNLLKRSGFPAFNQLEEVDAIGLIGQIDGVVFFC